MQYKFPNLDDNQIIFAAFKKVQTSQAPSVSLLNFLGSHFFKKLPK